MKRLLLLIVPLIALFGMNQFSADAQSRLKVVATTSLIADVAKYIGGDLVDVTAIIPAGSDVHGYIATPQDIALIADADVVLVNGLGMEQGLLEILEKNAPNAVIVSLGIRVLSSDHNHDDDHADDNHDDEPVSTEEAYHDDDDHHEADYLGIYGVDVDCGDHHDDDDDHEKAYIGRNDDDDDHDDDHEHGACDPHVWQNPLNVKIWAENIGATFADLDENNRDVYLINSQVYIRLLTVLDGEMRELIDTIPAENRVIVTNHNFLAYFAAEYGFEVVGTVIPSASSMAQVAPRDIADLVEIIREEGVRAIFAEYAVSTDLAQTVANEVGYEVAVVRLYSDSLGEAGGEAGTYLDFIRYNVNAIVNALSN